jgi:hypothetical protein
MFFGFMDRVAIWLTFCCTGPFNPRLDPDLVSFFFHSFPFYFGFYHYFDIFQIRFDEGGGAPGGNFFLDSKFFQSKSRGFGH